MSFQISLGWILRLLASTDPEKSWNQTEKYFKALKNSCFPKKSLNLKMESLWEMEKSLTDTFLMLYLNFDKYNYVSMKELENRSFFI